MKLKDLLEKRSQVVAAMRQITDNPQGQGGDLSEDQAHKFDEMRADLASLEKQIERRQIIDEVERRMSGEPIIGSGDDRFDDACRNFSLRTAIAAQVPDLNVDAGREREISQELQRRSGRAHNGITVPLSVFHERIEQRVITTTAPVGGPGSNIIATDHRGDQFIDLLRAALRVRGLGATVLAGLVGNVDIPRQKAAATAGWVAENAALGTSDLQFDSVALTPKHAGCITEFSRNMLMQSSPDVEQLIRRDFAAVLAQAVDSVAIQGGGSNEPTGVLGTAGIGSVAMGTNGGAITWDAVQDLIAEVDIGNALTGSLAFLTNAKVRKSGRKTLKVSGDAGAGFVWEQPNQLAGYTAGVTNLVPSNLDKGTSTGVCSALIFGNWADLLLGYWSELDVLVNPFESSAYAKGNVQVRGMLTVDVAVRHAESFAAIQDLTTA